MKPLNRQHNTLIPIDMGRYRAQALMQFDCDMRYLGYVVVRHGGCEAWWAVTGNRQGWTACWRHGSRGLKPSTMGHTTKYLTDYVRDHHKSFEHLGQ